MIHTRELSPREKRVHGTAALFYALRKGLCQVRGVEPDMAEMTEAEVAIEEMDQALSEAELFEANAEEYFESDADGHSGRLVAMGLVAEAAR